MCLGNLDWSKHQLDTPTLDLKNPILSNIIDHDDLSKLKLHTGAGNLNVLHLNVRSLRAKISEIINIIDYFANNDVILHVIALCETYITEYNKNFCQISGYQLEYLSRRNKHGGGVALFIKDDITYTNVDLNEYYCESSFECIALNLKLKFANCIVCEIYRAPNSDENYYMETLGKCLKKLSSSSQNVVIAGDFNYDLLKLDLYKNCSNHLSCFLDEKCIPYIQLPTRVTNSSCTLIDNIFVKNNPTHEVISSILCEDVSDHFPCFCSITNMLCKDENLVGVTYRKITEKGVFDANHELLHTDWTYLNALDCNDAYESFHSAVSNVLNIHLPIKHKFFGSTRPAHEPWYSKSILKCRTKCKKLYRESLKSDEKKRIYKAYRNSLNRLIKHEKHTFYNEKLNKFKSNMNVTWSILNGLMKRHKNKSSCISAIQSDGRLIDNSSILANEFNNHFLNAPRSVLPQSLNDNDDHLKYLKNQESSDNVNTSISELEVEKIIDQLKKQN